MPPESAWRDVGSLCLALSIADHGAMEPTTRLTSTSEWFGRTAVARTSGSSPRVTSNKDGDGLRRRVSVGHREHRVGKPLLEFGVVAELLEQLSVVLE